MFLRARLRSRGVRRFGAVPRAGRARDRARRASFGGGVDSVPPTVVEDGGTRGPASRPRAAVRSFPSPRVRLFGRRARGPRRLGRVARVRRRRLGARERAPSPRRRVSHAGGGRGGLGARARGRRSPLASRSTGRLRTARFPPTPRRASASTSTSSTTPRAFASRSPRPRMRCPAARDKNPLATAVARDDDDPTTRAWRDATARIRVARVDAARASVAEDELVPPGGVDATRPAAANARGHACVLLGEDSFEGRRRANRYPELAGVRSTVPPFPSTTARKRRASRGETRPGVYEPSATSTSAEPSAMSEVDASVALARVVAEALLRPTNTLNGLDLSGWPDQTSTPVVERDEESATATTMAAESVAVDALAAARGNLAEHRDATSRRTRRAGDAHEGGGASDRVEWDVRGARGDAVRGDARGAGGGGGGEATLVARRVSPTRALERGRLAARAATATASARVKTEVHAVDAAVDAGRTSAPSSAAVAPSAARASAREHPRPRRDPDLRGVTPPLGHPGRVSSPHLPAHDAFVVSNQSTAAAAAAVAPSAATEFLLANILGFASRPDLRASPTAWPSRARVVPASSRARRVRRLESINGGGGDGGHVRARRGEWFSTRRRAARLASRAISRRGDPARRRKRSTVRAPRAATDGGDATPGYGSGYRSGYGPGYGLERDGGRGTDVRASEAHVAGDARGGGEETRGNRGGRGGGETREARLGRRARGWSGEARTCSACR